MAASAAAWDTSTTLCPKFPEEPGAGLQYGFLPKAVRGVTILMSLGLCRWRVDDSKLKSGMESVAYRKSKNMDDKLVGVHALFGEEVEGVDEGDDWVKFRFKEVRSWAEPSHDSASVIAPTVTKITADG
ncbi:unnamed protein product [Prorocentrum cordatum]|uniref:Uncharacterized protein n=1 Tax=Prorocentrum cordatum TaxID=2364126 RepID=A0ABN9VRB8_9DINO|nr:unnamed protein product [Polarella glacialis]